MGINKNHIYTDDQIELARLFKALGHPARIAITENLLTHENLNCNGLRSYIQLAQSTISGHLKVLFEVGILAISVVRSNAYYQINKIALEQVSSYLQQVLIQVDMRKPNKEIRYCRPLPCISPHNFTNRT